MKPIRSIHVLTLLALCAAPCHAWWAQSHDTLTIAAVAVLPDDLPAFFRNAGTQIGHMAMDPDVVKNKKVPNAVEGEYAGHFFDTELLQGRQIPPTMAAFVSLCCSLGVSPGKVGFLPYTLAEWTERLAVAFAEYRRWPKNTMIPQKCFVYAGFLSHYAQDLCQPLHTTIHYDGKMGGDGVSPRSGVHEKVDALVERVGARSAVVAKGVVPAVVDSLMPFVLRELAATHTLVDTLYGLESRLPAVKGTKPAADVSAFAMERMQRAVAVAAGLYSYAWKLSGEIEFEEWLKR